LALIVLLDALGQRLRPRSVVELDLIGLYRVRGLAALLGDDRFGLVLRLFGFVDAGSGDDMLVFGDADAATSRTYWKRCSR
jgi:hypothetical protein